jgi:hypothetical protein
MAERKHITLIYAYNDNWVGGAYYILNIIRALQLLPDEEKPRLSIVHDDQSSVQPILDLNYPRIDFQPVNFNFSLAERVINRVSLAVLGRLLAKKKIPGNIRNLYPVSEIIDTGNVEDFYYWIPDFQERYLPHFFSERELKSRRKAQEYIRDTEKPVVFSSYNALADFDKFYPGNKNRKRVMQFVSIIDERYKELSVEALAAKFSITKPYFIVPNQFWRHKNHQVVLEALRLMNTNEFQVVFTGKEYDHRNPEYSAGLRSFVAENKLEGSVLFLGFIDRNEQLQLMKHSVAILQPSLFEGWSTVVEDTKALNHRILVSDLPVHREQISENCVFFDPRDPHDLSRKMYGIYQAPPAIKVIDYEKKKVALARVFTDLFG